MPVKLETVICRSAGENRNHKDVNGIVLRTLLMKDYVQSCTKKNQRTSAQMWKKVQGEKDVHPPTLWWVWGLQGVTVLNKGVQTKLSNIRSLASTVIN